MFFVSGRRPSRRPSGPVLFFLQRDAMNKHGLCVMRCLSVRPSSCPTRSCIVSKQVIISSKFSTIGQPENSRFFFVPSIKALFRRAPPNGGVECRCSMKSPYFRPMSRFIAFVNVVAVRCCKQSAARPWRVVSIHR